MPLSIGHIIKNNKIETETYYNADGLPTSDITKQFGVRYEYKENGQESAVINLDAAGNAMDNSNTPAANSRISPSSNTDHQSLALQ